MWGGPTSLRRRGLVLAGSFWVVIVALLGARVVLFDEIAAARVASLISGKLAALTALVF